MTDRNEPQLIGGKDSSGNLVAIKVLPDGSLSGIGNGGSGGDASATKQQEQIDLIQDIKTVIGSQSDALAAQDTSTASITSFIKRISTFTNNLFYSLGDRTDSAASSDTANTSVVSLFKRLLVRLTILIQVKPANTLPETNDTAIVTTLRDPISLSRKVSITGFTSTSSTNSNLLDASGNGNGTDVRDYQSGTLTIVSTATTGQYTVQCAFNSTFTIGVKTLLIQEIDAQGQNPILSSIVPNNTTRSFLLNLQGVNFIRVNMTSGASGVTAYAILNQAPSSSLQFNVQQSTASNLNANIGTVNSISNSVNVNTVTSVNSMGTLGTLNAIGLATVSTEIGTSAITATATSNTLTQTSGLSYIIVVGVGTVSGTNPVMSIEIQESVDNGGTWFSIYNFAPIINSGVYTSPKLPYSGNRIRYVQTVSGTSPSFIRYIQRYSYNDTPSIPVITRKLGGIASTADLPVYGRILKANVNNRTASNIFLQIFNKATPLTTGDIPVDIYPVNAGFNLILGSDVFGYYGTFLGVNARLGLSSTFDTYTAIAPLTNTSLFVDYI